jgi:hypothetical protein
MERGCGGGEVHDGKERRPERRKTSPTSGGGLTKKKKKKTSSSGAVGLSGKPTKTQGIGSLLTLHARGRSPLIIADLSP